MLYVPSRQDVSSLLEDRAVFLAQIKNELIPDVLEMAQLCIDHLKVGGTIYVCGNGGSAADSQHMTAELIASFKNRNRRSLPAVSLVANVSSLTAIANDWDYDYVFQRQLEGCLRPEDLLIAISTSGNSKNVLNAVKYANQHATVIALLGNKGGEIFKQEPRLSIVVPSADTALIQEIHLAVEHIVCELIDRHFVSLQKTAKSNTELQDPWFLTETK